MLLEARADPKLANVEPDREGDTALHAVSNHRSTQPVPIEQGVRVTKTLLGARADVRARNRNGATPLQFAAGPRPELVPLLLAAGADVNAADRNGRTALHVATQWGNVAVARLLLDRGADVNAEELGGQTPLLIARDQKFTELVQLIAARGGRINQAYYLKREAGRRLYELQRGRGH